MEPTRPPPPGSDVAMTPDGDVAEVESSGASGEDSAPEAAGRVFAEFIRRFCEDEPTERDLLAWLAPDGAIEAGGALLPAGGVSLPAGRAFLIRNDVVTSLNVGDGPTSPYVQVAWWRNQAATGEPIRELHAVADVRGRVLPYAEFVAEQRLGEPTRTEQGGDHPLGDLLHHHEVRCGNDRRVELVLSEIVWQGAAVGKIGELSLTRGRPAGAGARPVPPPVLSLTLEWERVEHSRDSNGERERYSLWGRALSWSWEYWGFHPDPEFAREKRAQCVLEDADLSRLVEALQAPGFRSNLRRPGRTEGGVGTTRFRTELRYAIDGVERTQSVGGLHAVHDDPDYARLDSFRTLLLHLRQGAEARGGCE